MSRVIWGIIGFAISRRRDKKLNTQREYKGPMRDALTLVISLGAWGVFAFWLHAMLIGVAPLGA